MVAPGLALQMSAPEQRLAPPLISMGGGHASAYIAMLQALPQCRGPAVASHAVEALHLGREGNSPTRVLVAEEQPVAFRYNGFPHAVMMATPDDLEDFAFGFSLTEGIIQDSSDIRRLEISPSEDGLAVEITLEPNSLHRYLGSRRVRQARGHPSCGLCGVEDLKDVRRPAARTGAGWQLESGQVQRALEALRRWQPLSRSTRGAHASAWVTRSGDIHTVREDIGRHNSLDKLIGAGIRGAFSPAQGFCLITSRCSYEMVQKAIMAGYHTLISAAAPTAFAIRTAELAGLTLYSLSREAGQFLYTAPFLSKDSEHDVKA